MSFLNGQKRASNIVSAFSEWLKLIFFNATHAKGTYAK
jgi:hypothetical protein